MAEVKNGNGHKAKRQRSTEGELTFDERRAAKKLNLSDRTLRRYRKQSQISYFRVGSRILYNDECLQKFLEQRRQTAKFKRQSVSP